MALAGLIKTACNMSSKVAYAVNTNSYHFKSNYPCCSGGFVFAVVTHERTHSTRRLIRARIPQGSTLSPLLYSAYINDIPRPLSSGVQLALFADDTALFLRRSRNRAFDSPPSRGPLTS
ncbi:hypothetical protein EVAR_93286_1 [Eumeta japonica]|uniref:Reverse transcriptase domain-containing protein n=1 Tax=Eumeta variegata TaxID=151549 RepID=A0A4C1UT53_EUMVA|nr:hypothetical protein EVAR_93286_1 [Eumeta japonica]